MVCATVLVSGANLETGRVDNALRHVPIHGRQSLSVNFYRVLRIPTVVVLVAFTSTVAPPPFPTARTPLHSRVSLEGD